MIESLISSESNSTIRLLNLKAETYLTYNDIPKWYTNITEAHEGYHIYGTVRVKYPVALEWYGFYPHKIFGSQQPDIISLTQETWYAEGKGESDSYNVILSDSKSQVTTEINNYDEDKSLDILYMPVNSIQAKKDYHHLHLHATNLTHAVKVKDYFLGDNYKHLVVINDNKDIFILLENSSKDVSLVPLPFYHATDNQRVFSLSLETHQEAIVDARLDDIRFYRDSNNLLLMDDKPLIVRIENFYDQHENWKNITLNYSITQCLSSL